MNCAGFVADVLARATGNYDSQIIKMLDLDSNDITNTNWWVNFVIPDRLPCEHETFFSIEAMLNSGYLAKGDIILFNTTGANTEVDSYNNIRDTHIGIFWGETSSEDKWWHSSHQVNAPHATKDSSNPAWVKTVFAGKATQGDDTALYGNMISTITPKSEVQRIIVIKLDNTPYEPDGYLQITKSLNATSPQLNTYKISGDFKFEVYSSSTKVGETTITFTNGTITKSSSNMKLEPGNYTVKEVSCPPGVIRDTSSKPVTVNSSNTESNPAKVTFTNDIRITPMAFVKKKVPTGYSAAGATFGIYNTQSDARNDINRLGSVTINGNGTSTTWSTTLDSANATKTIYVKELSPPTSTGNYTWKMSSEIKSATLNYTHTTDNPYEFEFENEVQEYGYIQVKKSVPSGYQPTGAQYGVYSNSSLSSDSRLGIVTIGSDGYSDKLKLNVPTGSSLTVYVKEIKAPTQTGDFNWILDTDTHSANINISNTESSPKIVNSKNDTQEYGYLRVKKSVPENYQPTGAEYGVYTSSTDAENRNNAIYTFTIGADGYSTTNLRVTLDANNQKQLYVRETKVPSQTGDFDWGIDNTIYPVIVTKNNTTTAPIVVESEEPIQEYGYVQVKKTVPSGYNPEGAEYTIYTNQNCTTPLTAEYFANGAVEKLKIDQDGNSNIIKLRVPTGDSLSIFIKETKIPDETGNFDWQFDTTVHSTNIDVKNTESKPRVLNSSEPVQEFGYIQVKKTVLVNDGNSRLTYSPAGAEYTLYSDALCTTPLTANTFSNNTVQKLVIDSDGNSNKVKLNVPTGGTLKVYVKETKQPTLTGDFDWELDTKVHSANVSITNTEADPRVIDSENEVIPYTYVEIYKKVPTGYSGEGAQYAIYFSESAAKADTNRAKVLTIGSDGVSTEQFRVEASTMLYVKEVKKPNQSGNFTWEIDTEIYKVPTYTTTPAKPIRVNSENKITRYGSVQVVKSNPANYPNTGAEYTLYSDSNCTIPLVASDFKSGNVEKFTIKADGSSNIIDLILPGDSGDRVVYIKETKKPNYTENGFEWEMDNEKYKVTVSNTNTPSTPVRVESENKVWPEGTIIKLIDDQDGKDLIDDAKFTIYVGDTNTIAKDIDGNQLKDLAITNGTSEKFTVLPGSYRIVETTVPEGCVKGPDQTVTITATDKNKTFTFTNHYTSAKARVSKSSDRLDLVSKYPIIGAQFTLYTNEACTNIAKDTKGNDVIMTVTASGLTSYAKVKPGTYWLKETKIPDFYNAMKPNPVKVTLEDGDEKTIDATNPLKPGDGKVQKNY